MAPSSAAAASASASLTAPDVEAVRDLVADALEADAVAPLSEEARLRLRAQPTEGVIHLLARAVAPGGVGRGGGGSVVGYAQLETAGDASDVRAELVVTPEARGRGVGGTLVEALLHERGTSPLQIWAHGDLEPARRLAARFGFERVRELRQLRAPLEQPPAEPVLPEGIRVRTFTPGRDEAAWLALNARAFATHPEQGGWTERDLLLREQEPWFDPDGFFLAERGERLVGFHWTKVEDASTANGAGEVYVLGVDPDEAGNGLGSALTAVGLRHLHGRGLRTVLLYVEATNAPALAVYERAGFRPHAVDVGYRYPGDTSA